MRAREDHAGLCERPRPARSAYRGASAARSMHHLAVRPVLVGEVDRAPQLGERAGLDLAHALARDAEVLAGLRERARDPVVEAIADAQHLLFALRPRAQEAVDLLVLEL